MTTLITIRGNSGSGKTTLALALQKKLGPNYLLISQDMIRREMLYVKDGPKTPAISLLTTLLLYGKDNCPFIILEGILNASWYAPLFEVATTTFSTNLFAYYYDLPFIETFRRHQTKSTASDFGEPEMKRWWTEKDLVPQLHETILTAKLSLDQTLELIWQDLAQTTDTIEL
ncbi:uridine kinase [Enterococcus sp. JM4C]|uniref:kinase n=1 Tax=Candidatus Enterococcus huntleyi TaxID=1857217 RepID=UPI001379C089|nr:kinase [Enterococcus sp. JM4C]KAF1298466.1 uridine kinase [Enterococcus sp. JM4C]